MRPSGVISPRAGSGVGSNPERLGGQRIRRGTREKIEFWKHRTEPRHACHGPRPEIPAKRHPQRPARAVAACPDGSPADRGGRACACFELVSFGQRGPGAADVPFVVSGAVAFQPRRDPLHRPSGAKRPSAIAGKVDDVGGPFADPDLCAYAGLGPGVRRRLGLARYQRLRLKDDRARQAIPCPAGKVFGGSILRTRRSAPRAPERGEWQTSEDPRTAVKAI